MSDNPYEALEKIFHEPNRLSIMSSLCRSTHGLTFNDLKEECRLTDGNLSRHLKALEDAGAIAIKKTFVGVKPQTTAILSSKGRQQFLDYLKALEEVLKTAAKAIGGEKKEARLSGLGKPARSKA
jgi:DNA-binding transcriptional ArsR family regulator